MYLIVVSGQSRRSRKPGIPISFMVVWMSKDTRSYQNVMIIWNHELIMSNDLHIRPEVNTSQNCGSDVLRR